MKRLIRNLLYSISWIYDPYIACKTRLKSQKHVYKNYGKTRATRIVQGSDNRVFVGKNSVLSDVQIHIIGNHNSINIGDNCRIGKGSSLWIEGNHCEINIGDETTFTEYVHVCVQEDNMHINLGKDCMLSNHIIIRTSDSHPIYNMDSRERVNPASSIDIWNHVWIAPDTKIMKGSIIEDGAIIGSDTTINGRVPSNTLAVGRPYRIVKSNVEWTRESLYRYE